VSRFTIYVGLSLVFLLSACQANGVAGSSVQTLETLPSPTSARTDTTEVLGSPVPTETAWPTFLYVIGNTFVKQVGNGNPEMIAEVPVAASVHTAVLTNNELFILDEQGIMQVNLADETYARLVTFDVPALAGQLTSFDKGSTIIYSAIIEDLSTQSSFATVIGEIEPKRKTEMFKSYQTTWVDLIGLTKDGKGLFLRPVGQDPEFDRIWLLDISKNDAVEDVYIQGIGTLVTSLSPNAQFLVTMGQIPITEEQPEQPPPEMEAVLSLYDLSSSDLPTHRDFALPNSPSHFREVLWSGNSQRVYFLLLSGKYWEEPTTSYGIWSFDIKTAEMSQIVPVSDVDLALSRISPDGEWILLAHQSKGGVLSVHIPTGKSQFIDIPKEALIVAMWP